MITITCEACGKLFQVPPIRLQRHVRWCSRACRKTSGWQASRKRVAVTCGHCGKAFSRFQSLLVNKHAYCSRKCADAAKLKALPAHQPTPAEWAWLAGFIDGEGSIQTGWTIPHRETGKKYYRINISIQNTHKETMEHIAQMLGVRMGSHRWANHERWKMAYRVSIGSKALTHWILQNIEPFVVTKRQHVHIALRLLENLSDQPAMEELRLLNHRGRIIA